MTEEELFGLTADEKRREHIQRRDILPPGKLVFDLMTQTISSVAAMQLRQMSLFADMIRGTIAGYRVEMDRSGHPATFHITTWR